MNAVDCLLFRHGIAVEREDWTGKDADRPLTDRGKQKVRQVVAGLRALELQPTHVFASPFIRAVETAKILQAVWPLPSTVQLTDALLPDASPETLLDLFRALPPESCVICVGHEPHLGQTAGLLLCGRPSESFVFKKAGACLIEWPIRPNSDRGRLHWWFTPGQLRALGKRLDKSKKDKKEKVREP